MCPVFLFVLFFFAYRVVQRRAWSLLCAQKNQNTPILALVKPATAVKHGAKKKKNPTIFRAPLSNEPLPPHYLHWNQEQVSPVTGPQRRCISAGLSVCGKRCFKLRARSLPELTVRPPPPTPPRPAPCWDEPGSMCPISCCMQTYRVSVLPSYTHPDGFSLSSPPLTTSVLFPPPTLLLLPSPAHSRMGVWWWWRWGGVLLCSALLRSSRLCWALALKQWCCVEL